MVIRTMSPRYKMLTTSQKRVHQRIATKHFGYLQMASAVGTVQKEGRKLRKVKRKAREGLLGFVPTIPGSPEHQRIETQKKRFRRAKTQLPNVLSVISRETGEALKHQRVTGRIMSPEAKPDDVTKFLSGQSYYYYTTIYEKGTEEQKEQITEAGGTPSTIKIVMPEIKMPGLNGLFPKIDWKLVGLALLGLGGLYAVTRGR